MPKRTLNPPAAGEALSAKGLSQSDLARKLEVSREAVSKWFLGKSAPRPDKLLDLAILLDRDVNEISALATDPNDPVIAFRRKGNAKITNDFVSHAQHMGRLLTPLTDFLPFDQLVSPRQLKNPRCEFEYLERASMLVRKQLKVKSDETVAFQDLVGLFRSLQAVLVPVLWGTKKNHRNAVHIYLPESTTTWVYLNLDTNAFDFLFWMAHELGHVLSASLRGDEAEDFADAFAGALLFPANFCEGLDEELSRKRTDASRLSTIVTWADHVGISPITIAHRVNAFREACDEPGYKFGNRLYAASANLNKQYLRVSEAILGESRSSAADFIAKCESEFKTPFFAALRKFSKAECPDAAFFQAILDIPLSDAKAIRAELC